MFYFFSHTHLSLKTKDPSFKIKGKVNRDQQPTMVNNQKASKPQRHTKHHHQKSTKKHAIPSSMSRNRPRVSGKKHVRFEIPQVPPRPCTGLMMNSATLAYPPILYQSPEVPKKVDEERKAQSHDQNKKPRLASPLEWLLESHPLFNELCKYYLDILYHHSQTEHVTFLDIKNIFKDFPVPPDVAEDHALFLVKWIWTVTFEGWKMMASQDENRSKSRITSPPWSFDKTILRVNLNQPEENASRKSIQDMKEKALTKTFANVKTSVTFVPVCEILCCAQESVYHWDSVHFCRAHAGLVFFCTMPFSAGQRYNSSAVRLFNALAMKTTTILPVKNAHKKIDVGDRILMIESLPAYLARENDQKNNSSKGDTECIEFRVQRFCSGALDPRWIMPLRFVGLQPRLNFRRPDGILRVVPPHSFVHFDSSYRVVGWIHVEVKDILSGLWIPLKNFEKLEIVRKHLPNHHLQDTGGNRWFNCQLTTTEKQVDDWL